MGLKRKNPSTTCPERQKSLFEDEHPRLFQILSIQKNKANRRFLILLYESSATRKEMPPFMGNVINLRVLTNMRLGHN